MINPCFSNIENSILASTSAEGLNSQPTTQQILFYLEGDSVQGIKLSKREAQVLNNNLNDMLKRIGIMPNDHSTDQICDNRTILAQLIKEKDESLQEPINQFDKVVSNFFKIREKFKDFLISVCRLLTHIFLATPLTMLLKLFSIFNPSIDNKFYKIRESALTKTIRTPLFDSTKKIISAKLAQHASSELNPQTKLQYILLLSSLDREKTKKFLSEETGEKLLSGIISEPINHDNETQKNPINKIEDIIYSLESSSNADKNEILLLKKIHKNLTLGEKIGLSDGERTALKFADSPFVRHPDLNITPIRSQFEQNRNTSVFLRLVILSIFYENDSNNQEFLNLSTDWPNSNFSYKDGLYTSSDEKLQAGIRYGPQIDLASAEVLGLVTPETVNKLLQEHPDKNKKELTIQLLCMAYLPFTSSTDLPAAANNIMDLTPKSIEHADHLVQKVIEKVNNDNANKDIPYVVLMLGHSLGGMVAHSMGAKYNCASLGFNPLGIGEGIRDTIIGKDKVEQANDDEHANCHQSYIAEKDWVSDDEGFAVAKLFIRKPYIGQTYKMSLPDSIKNESMLDRHNQYEENIRDLLQNQSMFAE